MAALIRVLPASRSRNFCRCFTISASRSRQDSSCWLLSCARLFSPTINRISSRSIAFVCPASAVSSTMPPQKEYESIHLSDLEQKIFDTLKAVVSHFHLNIQLRVAGGWVRDKLLGKDCHDIDIALEDMLGKDFCEKVNEYLTSINEEVRSHSVIQSNPDQSKHLETARMKVFGVEIDFVNLRSENYSEDSRIPTMKFGTPEEDAFRRDLTINSLFYNINTSSVEDFTGKGLSDLRNRIIATPLSPKLTFLDDPLRVLRAVRFASRFGYKLQDELKQAAADKDVKFALENKVSPERVGIEIDLMMKGPNPVRAIQELADMDIFWVVFRMPQLKTPVSNETQRVCLKTLDALSRIVTVFGAAKFTTDQKRIGFYAAVLLPLRTLYHENNKKKQIPLPNFIMKDSLKLKASDADMVVLLHEAAENFHTIIGLLLDEEEQGNGAEDVDGAEEWECTILSRKAIAAGFVLTKIKDLWKMALLLESLMEPTITSELQEEEVKQRAERCLAVETAVMDLGLDNVWKLRPLLDGRTIMAELGLAQGGPQIKEWHDKIRRWQWCHLTGSADECLEWFRGQCKKKRQRCG